MSSQKIIEFLKSHPLIKVRGLEVEAEIPNDTIRNAMEGKDGREIPEKHVPKIVGVLKKYGFK